MNKSLTNRQIAIIIYSSVFAYGIISLPREVTEFANTGGWFSLIIAAIIFTGIAYIITYLHYTFEYKTLYEYGQQLIGKVLTYIVLIVLIVYLFVFFSIVVRSYTEIIKLILLPKTPVIALCILFYILVGYALVKGINAVSRFCEIACLVNILGFIFMISVLATKGKLINIQPLFFTDDFPKYIQALQKTLFPFIGLEVLYFLPINRIENRNIFKYTTLIVVLIGIMYIYVLEVCISVVGVDAIVNYEIPLLSIIKGVDIYHLEFLRRLDGICIFFWSLNIISSTCLRGCEIVTFTHKIAKKFSYNYIIAFLMLLALIVSQIPKTADQMHSILKYNSYIGIGITIVLPIILFIATKVKKYDRRI